MKKFIVFILLGGIWSCSPCDYNISNLDMEEISYYEAPDIVKKVYKSPSEYEDNYGQTFTLICLSESDSFNIERINFIKEPWVAYTKLYDLNKKISYKIEYKKPTPLIIYQNKLYIQNQYLDVGSVNLSTLTFFRYSLK